jgi:hypothetical protein
MGGFDVCGFCYAVAGSLIVFTALIFLDYYIRYLFVTTAADHIISNAADTFNQHRLNKTVSSF